VVAYWIGAWGGRPLVLRYGKYVLMSAHDLDRIDAFFAKYGSITVLVGRLLPVVRTFIAFPAGIARMPQLQFHLYTFIGSWPWCFVLAYAGMRLGSKWRTDPRFHEWFHRFHLVVELALVAAIVWFVWTHWQKRGQGLKEA
jgi:membrane protein DedA with SNARE-associated domain